MKKVLLFLMLMFSSLQLFADSGKGFIGIYKTDGTVDSIAVNGLYNIAHVKYDLTGKEYEDYVAMVVTTEEGEWKYLLKDVLKVEMPQPMESLNLIGQYWQSGDNGRRIYFNGTFPYEPGKETVYRWEIRDSIYIQMADQQVQYKTKLDSLTKDSTYAWFEKVRVHRKQEPVYIYYPGHDAPAFNKVRIARNQKQLRVNSSLHIGHSGDCATDEAVKHPDPAKKDVYTFNLLHHPAFFTFLTYNPRVPSVKVKKVTMIADKPISGIFSFDHANGIDLKSVENGNDTITLETPFFFDDGWKHTPRYLEHAQDSTAAYMVVAPQKDVKFDLIFNVVDTLSLIDTTFVKSYHLSAIKPNTIYTVKAEVPDTLFSIVDLGLGDIKYAFRNVEAYFERGPVSFYGGAFSYGESETKNNYEVGGNNMSNYFGRAITEEFVPKGRDKTRNATGTGDAAFQRWGEWGCWRLPQNEEIDSLLKKCKSEWTEYNGTEGALITGPSGKRIFLPVSDICRNYWSVDRSKELSDFRYWVPGSPGWGGYYVYRDIPILGIDKFRTDSTAFHNYAKFYDPGYARGVIEYSNYLKSNTDYDGSLMLLRHIDEGEATGGNFTINGMVRCARPWPKRNTVVQLQETGFIFGTDSATLYYDETRDREWHDSLFIKNEVTADQLGSGVHVKLKAANNVGVAPFVDVNDQQPRNIVVTLSGKKFLGYLDKEKKYYVREYFRMLNPVSKRYDYYYASKATQIKGFFPHTDSVKWVVNEKTATVNGYVVGVSTEVAGKVGFVIQEFDKSKDEFKKIKTNADGHEREVWWSRADSIYHNLTIKGSKFFEADNGGETEKGMVRNDMTFSYTIPRLDPGKYYFARGVFATFNKVDGVVKDTTFVYAPEVSVVQPLDTIDLGVGYGVETRWASLNVEGQFPEDHDSTYVWDSDREHVLPAVITDIGGTTHDVVFRKWYGEDGWVFTMPSKEQLEELLQNCDFTYMDRFDRQVLKVDGPNGNYMFLQDHHYSTSWGVRDDKDLWTSKREGNSAFYNSNGSDLLLSDIVNSISKYHVRPVLQTNGTLSDGSLLFIQTDTVARSQAQRGEMLFYGRALGVTPKIKQDYQIERGFVMHDFKGGEIKDTPCGIMPDTTTLSGHSNDGRYNGLYSVPLPNKVRDTLRSDKDYWYRAYIQYTKGSTTEYFYGVPKKLSPLTVGVDSIFWEVHENKATLGCRTDGTVFIHRPRLEKLVNEGGALDLEATTGTKLGFIVGDSANITFDRYETLWEYQYKENEEIIDSTYRVVMDVPKDTVYWVRAYVVSDGMIRYSEARQFGLDYVDLGLPSHRLWANISVGAGYPEDDHDYFSQGEPSPKRSSQSAYNSHAWTAEGEGEYNYVTYVVDTLRYVRYDHLDDHKTTNATKTIQLKVPNPGGKEYDVPYRGAIRELSNCSSYDGNIYWKHFSGTKNDAAYMSWQNSNPLFENTEKYIPNTEYGDLFVEPNNEEWKELTEACAWKYETVYGVPGWRVTGPNGNSLFLPLKGRKESNYRYNAQQSPSLQWDQDTACYHTLGYYHVADSIQMVKLTTTGKNFEGPGDYGELSWSQFYNGFGVRPIARYNLPLTKGADKLRDDTLAYLKTDTVTYLKYRTAVALQGTYRINYPMTAGKYELGFVLSDCTDAEKNNITMENCKYSALQTKRNASQYFVVLDNTVNLKDSKKLESDKTYFYRFFLHTKEDGKYYYADADSFHLADHYTKDVTWHMYETTATIRGLVQGVMPAEAQSAGFKAALIVSHKRDLKATDGDLLQTFDLTSQLQDYDGSKGGPISASFTLPQDSTYYYRLYVYYNSEYHYGDVNLFGYELLDLGLPSGRKWASINVGGGNPLQGMATTAINENHGIGQGDVPYRRAASGSRGIKGSGDAEDWAQTHWHNVYRMPYGHEAQELIDNLTWTADTIFGQPGVRGTAANGKSIFFRHSQNYWQGNTLKESDTDYSLSYAYMDIRKSNSNHPDDHKPYVSGVDDHTPGCQGVYFERPVFESNILLNPTGTKDHLLIRTDDAIIHPQVNYVTFFGSFIGTDQQRFGGSRYNVAGKNVIEHCGFIVGRDTLVTHTGDGAQYKKYDFPHTGIKTDSIFYYDRQNINIFKVDTTYWVRAYVKIDGQYYYGRSIKFVRQPNIETGDVEWAVGKTTAKLHGSVIGFNNDDAVGDGQEEGEFHDMEEIAKNARVGIIVGYNDDLTDADLERGAKLYDLGHAVNGAFMTEVPYDRDTTYYYRAYIYYNGNYVFAKHTNHYGLEFVDLGMPMQWASINVGSRFAEDESHQFSWGDTIANRRPFTFDNYPYYYATGDDEYNNLGNEFKGSQHDVAHVKWNYTWDKDTYGGRGSLWAMPSEEDLQMLVDSCTWTEVSQKGNFGQYVKGYRVTSKKNGNSIFVSGARCDEYTISGYHDQYGPFDYGPLWTSSRAPRERNAYGIQAGTNNRLMKYHYRYHGHFVRPMAHINAGDARKRLSIMTERTDWTAGAKACTIYGCVLGLNESYRGTYGFVVGATPDVSKANAGNIYTIQTNSAKEGLFSKSLTQLDNNRMYYFRAFLDVNGKTYYGEVKEFGIVMVDLGLTSGTRWANVNMGSWKPKDHGDFYGWGETTTKDVFTMDGYKYFTPASGSYRDLGSNISGNDSTDVANKMLGGRWRMAGDEEWNELMNECNWTPDTVAHIPGFRVSSKKAGNTNSIFLPANYYNPTERDANYDLETNENGERTQNHDDEVAHRGYYWSSNRSQDYRKAREVCFIDSVTGREVPPQFYENYRYRGNAIRPVASANRADFYLRTDATDWRYKKDTVRFYAVILFDGNRLPEGYEAGFVIGTSPDVTTTTPGIEKIEARPSTLGSGDYVGVYMGNKTDAVHHEGNKHNDGVWYYRVYVKNGTQEWLGDARQFGLQPVELADGLQWANINVDAASPEDIGLNGVPTGKYQGVDPAYAEFGGLWHMPSDEVKQQLLTACDWTEETIYGTKMWKVASTSNPSHFIYLMSKDPSLWGYRAITQSNITFDDGKTAFLRTDSTNWRAGYADGTLYASLVIADASAISERGFVLGTTPDVTHESQPIMTCKAEAEKGQIGTSDFSATMDRLPVGTYYYRAYVKYSDGKYYYDSPSDAKQVGIDFIDLGLSSGVKWANVNLGATIASDKGDTYAWGDTRQRSTYTRENYPYYDPNTGYADIGADITADTQHDVAALKIEGTRLPSQTDLDELMANCTWTAETHDGTSGYRVASTNGNSIFLPMGDYWTATQQTADNSKAWSLSQDEDNQQLTLHEKQAALRYLGKMIRPVQSAVTTTEATGRTVTEATLNGIVSVGNYTERGFEYSRSAAMLNPTAVTVTGTATGTFSATVTALAESSIYYYRAYAVISGTKYYGTVKSFTTKSSAGMKAIDLGLSVKWADRNVGSAMPETDGEYYAWGDLATRPTYSKTTYQHHTDGHYVNIGRDVSASPWDVATVQYGGCWRMPTQAEVQELLSSCTWTWATKEGVPGYWVGNAASHQNIFLPAAGYRDLTYLHNNHLWGHYWASTVNGEGSSSTAYAMSFDATRRLNNAAGISGSGSNLREYGFTVRPVYDSNGAVGGQDVFIRTDSIAYSDSRTQNTLYGTMLGLTSAGDGLTQGFVIGTSPSVDQSTSVIAGISQPATANGSYRIALTDEQLQSLTVGEVYYVRAFVSKGDDTKYGEPVELTDYSFFTDSVQWGLGNEGRLYGHIKAQKPESGLEIGFFYATDSQMSNKKAVTATFGTAARANVFEGVIDTVKVATYYYQAYTKYKGVIHTGAVRQFGARVVDLGLPSGVQWVDMNLGSDHEEQAGDHYRWGDTSPSQSGAYSVPAARDYIGGTTFDAAHTRLGSGYRLPSVTNLQELIDECNWQWQVNGFRVVSKKNGRSIFLPVGQYWSSQQADSAAGSAVTLLTGTTSRTLSEAVRTTGLLLRPTLNPKSDVESQGGNAGTGGNGSGDVEGNE